MQHNSESMLKKDIGTIVAMSIVIGSVIGSGIFMKPGKVISASGDSTMALWAWILGGLITIASGLTIVELATQIPKTGGLYVYLEEVYGKLWGYLCGWVQTLIYGPAVIAALGLYFGSLVAHFFGWGPETKLYIGIGTIVFLAVVNSIGTKYGGFVQTLATAGKLIPIALIAIFGIWQGDGQILNMASGVTEKTGMAAAILATLWAYDGWLLVGFVAGEMKNPAKILPRAIIIGLSVVTVAYISVNIAMLHVLPASEIAKLGENAAGTTATILFGGIGGKLISIGIMVSIFGCLNGKILTFPRVPLAMAERGQLPFSRLLSQVQPDLGTPIFATVFQVVLALLMMFVADPDRLSDIAIFAIYVFYILAFVAIFILRKKNSAALRTYSVPGYPIIPLVAIVGSGFIVISTIFDNPTDTLLALIITVIGLPIYWVLNCKSLASAKQEG
ncbi:amino acid abc transporter, permease protein [Heliomicrobium modesticaldum Ice1]|uniref:Amino acid abc transporter, permease protein n=1 Tax=Heliobacterium modesticaldum (strain ATCC 51547 / Ice1) TaxID=498761 RepID=B0TBD7_HELMI|nr:amino acid permease [Heliomicrobium modesticaldum]ABZ85150.1 amino acid abc transporter, permease protein [Heliomicrobium modesticaldum Ice1]